MMDGWRAYGATDAPPIAVEAIGSRASDCVRLVGSGSAGERRMENGVECEVIGVPVGEE